MKSIYFSALIMMLPLFMHGQFNEEVSGVGNVNININPGDTINLQQIDSILKSWNEALNAQEPPSNNFGHEDLKRDSVQMFQPHSVVRIPDSYVLGIDDEIAISIFGRSQFEGKFKIDKSGFISPQQMPKIYLKGLTLAQARKLAIKRFSSYYRFNQEQIALVVSEPRLITVNIFGEVERPGSYSLLATNTAYNALIVAGGPTDHGSIREIGIHADQEHKTMDVYEIMRNPSAQFDYYLEDNVIIRVPPVEKRVMVRGAITNPLSYDLKEGEGLFDLIEYAGGLKAQTVKEVISIGRYENDKKILLDVNLNDLETENKNLPLKNGDDIYFRHISPITSNGVFVEGAVELTGSYSFYDGLRISDILGKVVLQNNARRDVAFIMRMNTDNTVNLMEFNVDEVLANIGNAEDFALQNYDRIIINDQSDFVERSTISVSGAVRNEEEYPFHQDAEIKLNQAILLSGGLLPEAKNEGYVIRSNPGNQKEKTYIKIAVRDAIQNENGPSNIDLLPWDEVVVLSKSKSSDLSSISISGAVREELVLTYNENLSLKDLITLASGLKERASKKLSVFRLNLNEETQSSTSQIEIEIDDEYNIISGPKDFKFAPFDEVVVYKLPEFEMQKFVHVRGQVVSQGRYALTSKNERLTSVIKRAGGLSSEAFPEGTIIYRLQSTSVDSTDGEYIQKNIYFKVITQLDKALLNQNSKYNSILKDGDVIQIPKKIGVVYIDLQNTQGESINQLSEDVEPLIAVPYENGKNAKWYIEEYAGGIAKKTSPKMIKVEYANGGVKRGKGGLFKSYPVPGRGSKIYVGSPESSEKETLEKNNSLYPKLKKGVILNITPDGKITETSTGN